MLTYFVQRMVLVLASAILVSSVVFVAIHQLPGTAFLEERPVSPEQEAAMLAYYHLDEPLPAQYMRWLSGVLAGDLGESLVNRGVKITPLLLGELRVSATLGFFAMLFAVTAGVALGIIGALRHNTWVDYLATITSVIGYSIPNFVVATLLILLTVNGLYHWTGGAIYADIGWGKLEQVPVPAIALGLMPMAIVARLTRASMLEVLGQEYVRTAHAKGLAPTVVTLRHALRNALIPVVTVLGPIATGVITGSVVIEAMFGIPGLGKEFVTSILNRDYHIVVGLFTFYAALVGTVNVAVDLAYPLMDPQIKY